MRGCDFRDKRTYRNWSVSITLSGMSRGPPQFESSCFCALSFSNTVITPCERAKKDVMFSIPPLISKQATKDVQLSSAYTELAPSRHQSRCLVS